MVLFLKYLYALLTFVYADHKNGKKDKFVYNLTGGYNISHNKGELLGMNSDTVDVNISGYPLTNDQLKKK